MPRGARTSTSQDLIGRISDTIASHSRVSAAAAFQMGVLLGQAMHNTGALKGLKRTMAAAPSAIASNIPTFGLFDGKPSRKKGSGRGQAAGSRAGRPAKKTGASRRRKRASA